MCVKILTSNLALKLQWKRNFAPFKKNFCFVIVIIIVIWKKKKKNIMSTCWWSNNIIIAWTRNFKPFLFQLFFV